MSIPAVDNNHLAEGLAKLTEVFKKQPVIKAVLTEYLRPFQEIETLFWSIINSRILDNNPTGDQLDQIGGLVGEERLGRTDTVYLTAIKLRIRVNRSQGRAEDIIQIANLISPSTYHEFYPAKWTVRALFTTADIFTFRRMLLAAKLGGSGGTLEYTLDPDENTFFWGSVSDPVAQANSRGFGSVSVATTDNLLAIAQGI